MKILLLFFITLSATGCITFGNNNPTNIDPIKNELPKSPEYFDVNFINENDQFCFNTREDVKNYLKNENLRKAYILQLENTIQELIKMIEKGKINP